MKDERETTCVDLKWASLRSIPRRNFQVDVEALHDIEDICKWFDI